MRPSHIILACLASIIWGLAFVFTKFGLDSFSAPQLTVLRFLIACPLVFFLPRPAVSWSMLVAIGLTLFAGQFLLLFFAFKQGMPPGLASITQQTQAFFTVLLAAGFLGERSTPKQWVGMATAFAGLGLIALSLGGDVGALGLGLALASAFSWAIGNVLVKRLGKVSMLPLMAWLSLVPPLPALLVSALLDPAPSLIDAIADASWLSLAAVIYLGAVATILAYAIWGGLLTRYPSSVVAPFALLAPCVGMLSSAIVFGEAFGAARYGGMALILLGLAVIVLPIGWLRASRAGR